MEKENKQGTKSPREAMFKIMINKSLRSIWRNKKSYFSGIFVLIVGLGMYIGFLSAYLAYMNSVRQYHIDTNFADVFATVRTMPASSVDRLTRIDGVAEAQGMLMHSTHARLDSFDDLIGVLLVGVDYTRPMIINQMDYIGEPVRENNDILVSSSFWNAHGLNMNDTISLLINGQYQDFIVRGTALHPEYIFPPSVGGGIGDEVNTVGFVQLSVVETSSSMQGAVNNIRLTLEPGIYFDDVEDALTLALERYGIITLLPREGHFSYIILISQSQVFSLMGTTFPIILLLIAVGMLYITLKRIITLERTEIGTMKAMGFSSLYVVSGYLVQGALAAVISFTFAIVFGWFAGNSFYGLIYDGFDLAWEPFSLNTTILISGFFIAIFASLIGVLMGARSSLKVRPAEAMREEPPTGGGKGAKFDGFLSRLILSTGGKIGLRSMQRNKRRVLITVLSIAIIFASMNTFFTMGQVISDITDAMFFEFQVRDGTILLQNPQPSEILAREIGQLPGVLEVEASLSMVVELENNMVTRPLVIEGIHPDAQMFNIIHNDGTRLTTAGGGLILSTFFADELGLRIGDMVSVSHTSFHTNKYVELTQVVEAAVGTGAYMDIAELSRLFGSETIANTVMINVVDGYLPIIFDILEDASNIIGLNDSAQAHEFARINADMNVGIFNIINIVSIILCFAVVYNISNISLGEKQREYATLRVLGFQVPEVSEINTFEYVIMLLVGSGLGLIISSWLIPAQGALASFEASIIAPQLVFGQSLLTFIGVSSAVIFSCILTRRQITKFNLVDTLKER